MKPGGDGVLPKAFSFDQTLYSQIDGLAMGSTLSPTLSNLFIGVLEHKFLHKNMLDV